MTEEPTDEILIKEAKRNNKGSTQLLLERYNTLIYKTANRVYQRYQKYLDFLEISEQAKQSFLVLALIEYKSNGKARFPYYIKHLLHARLVNIYRPEFNHHITTISIENKIIGRSLEYSVEEHTGRAERKKRYNTFIRFIDRTFSKREKTIFVEHICDGIPRAVLARQFGISYTRMTTLYTHILHKIVKWEKEYDRMV